MHCLDGLGVVKADIKTIDALKSKKIKCFPSDLEGYCFVVANKGWQKKIVASTGIDYILYVYTDYFGGCGEQSSRLINITMDWQERKRPQKFRSINQGLKALGVVKKEDEFDEFDTVGLGHYRSMDDVYSKFK